MTSESSIVDVIEEPILSTIPAKEISDLENNSISSTIVSNESILTITDSQSTSVDQQETVK